MLLSAVLSGVLVGLFCATPLVFLAPEAFESED
jgi:hypothetical protein